MSHQKCPELGLMFYLFSLNTFTPLREVYETSLIGVNIIEEFYSLVLSIARVKNEIRN